MKDTEMAGEVAEARWVGPLPLLAELIRRLGIPETIDACCGRDDPRQILSIGERILAVLLSVFCGYRPLYRVKDFFTDTAAELLFGYGIRPEHLNDDCLARALDAMADAGPARVFSAVAMQVCLREEIAWKAVHFDTTSVSLYGEYREGASGDLQLVRGYSRDGHPELRPFVLALLTNEEGVPLWAQMRNGNSADAGANAEAIEAYCAAFSADQLRQTVWIGDSALVSKENLDRIARVGLWFISRLPERFEAAERVKQAAWRAGAWEELGVLAQQERPDSARYQVAEQEVEIEGRRYRAIVVRSSARAEEPVLERQLEGERVRLERALERLQRRRFGCRGDAEAACAAWLAAQGETLHRVRLEVVEQTRELAYARRGRPRRGERRPTVTEYVVRGQVEAPAGEVLAWEAYRRSSFVLVTNLEDREAWSARRVLEEYRAQGLVEQKFRFVKDPRYVPGVWLHTPRRIEALGYVFAMACLVYSVFERRVRRALAERGAEIVVAGQRRTRRPTGTRLLEKLEGLVVARGADGRWHFASHHLRAGAVEVAELAGVDFAKAYAVAGT